MKLRPISLNNEPPRSAGVIEELAQPGAESGELLVEIGAEGPNEDGSAMTILIAIHIAIAEACDEVAPLLVVARRLKEPGRKNVIVDGQADAVFSFAGERLLSTISPSRAVLSPGRVNRTTAVLRAVGIESKLA